MSANKFVLKGSGVEVDYTIGANPAFPAFVYTAGAFQKKFKPAEILSEDTGSAAVVLQVDGRARKAGAGHSNRNPSA